MNSATPPGGTERNRDYILDLERARGLVNVVGDGPQGYGSAVPAVWEVTCADYAMVRLHGRNHGTWERKGLKAASERFDYWYDKKELKTLVPNIKALEAKEVHVLFNNNNQDQGQKGAALLKSLV